MKTKIKKITLLMALSVASHAVVAVPASALVGQWTLFYHKEPNLAAAGSIGICFLSGGGYYSTLNSPLITGGKWFLKGDSLRLLGEIEYDTSLGLFMKPETYVGQFSSAIRVTGVFGYVFPSAAGDVYTFGNFNMVKVKATCDPSAN